METLESRTLLSVAPLNVALVSDAVAQAQEVRAAAAKDTIAIVYQSDNMTTTGLVDLLASVSAAHNGLPIGNLAIVAHGNSGEIDLGKADDLNLATLPGQTIALERLRSVLANNACLDLYSCDVAAGASGKAFVNDLAAVTGATVYASDNLVGTVPGANLVLAYHRGPAVASNDLFSAQEMETIRGLCLPTYLTAGQVAQAAYGAGFSGGALVNAIAVADAESTFQLDATNADANGTVDRGLWQINSVHSEYNAQQLLSSASYNATAAHNIFTAASGWTPWSTFNNGAFSNATYLQTARTAAQGIDSTVVRGTNDRVTVTANGVNVRLTAGGATSRVQVNAGATGTVLGGPVVATVGTGTYRYIWWDIHWDDGLGDGWVAEDYLSRTGTAAAPVVQTAVANSVTANSAVMNGTVNPNGASTSAYFQYGTTTSYGSTAQTVTGITTTQNLQTTLTGLAPSTTYHYRIVASSSGGTSYGNDMFFTTAGVQAAPVNNNFANRTSITGTSATVTGTNVGATKESGEPNPVGNSGGKSAWWTWTAPSSGSVQIDTIGSSFDTILGVYTGSSVSSLATMASDDDSGGNYTSKVTFNAVGGTTYQIAVDGYNYGSGATSGNITLHVNLTLVATPVLNVSTTSLTLPATIQGVAGATASFTVSGSGLGSNDTLNLMAPAGSEISQGGTSGFVNTFLLYPNSSGNLATTTVYVRTSASAAANVSGNLTISDALHSSLNKSILISGTVTPLATPVNNNFANRTSINGTSATVTGTNVGATKESGEPNPVGNSGGKSVWWTWTAPFSGSVQIDTIGSNFDTILGVYTGSSVSSLTTIASDDDSGGNLTSKVAFNAVSGTTYQIAVDGYNAASGNITLHVNLTTVTTPVNDSFANRTLISGTSATMTGTNVGATKESGEPNPVGNSGGKSVWWTWTAPSSGSVQIDTIGSSFDTILGVYTGSTVSSLTTIASDDDSGGNYTSKVTFNAVAGTAYQIAVDGYNYNYGSGAASGNITLHVNFATTIYDGTTPAPGTTGTNRGVPATPSVQSDPSNRSVALYNNVINQFAVQYNPRYAQVSVNGVVTETWCNIFSWDVTSAMGAPIPHWVDRSVYQQLTGSLPANNASQGELTATLTALWLESQGAANGWSQVSAADAQSDANLGRPVVVCGDGHIAIVRPGSINANGPTTAQAGLYNFNLGHVYPYFPQGTALEYWAHA
jgi:hypothetical protein